MNTGKILTTEAAAILNTSPQFVRVAMQQGKLPIGIAIKMSTKWTYNISGKLLTEYSGKDVEKELEQIRKKKVMQTKEKSRCKGGIDSGPYVINQLHNIIWPLKSQECKKNQG